LHKQNSTNSDFSYFAQLHSKMLTVLTSLKGYLRILITANKNFPFTYLLQITYSFCFLQFAPSLYRELQGGPARYPGRLYG